MLKNKRVVAIVGVSLSSALLGVAACSDDDDGTTSPTTVDSGSNTADVISADSKNDSAQVTDSGAGGDADDGAASACRAREFTTKPELVPGLSGANVNEIGATFSKDELSVIFSRENPDSGLSFDLYAATRLTVNDSFGAPVHLDAVSDPSAGDLQPSLSGDGLTLFFQRSPTTFEGVLYQATRASTATNVFAPPVALSPFTGLFNGQPFIREDGKFMYYVYFTGGNYQIYRAVNDGGAKFSALSPANGLNGHVNQGYPVVTADELTAFYAGDVGNNNYDIFTASRATTADQWTNEKIQFKISSLAQDYPLWISPDGCRLYMASTRNTEDGGVKDYDVYLAKR